MSLLAIFLQICHHWWVFKGNAFMHCHNAPINAKTSFATPLNHHPTDTTIHTYTHSTQLRKHTTLTNVTVGDIFANLSPLVSFQRECNHALSQCTNQCKNGIRNSPQPSPNWHNYSHPHTFNSLKETHNPYSYLTVGDLSTNLSPLVRFQRECIYALSKCTNQCINGIHTSPQPPSYWHNYSHLNTFNSLKETHNPN